MQARPSASRPLGATRIMNAGESAKKAGAKRAACASSHRISADQHGRDDARLVAAHAPGVIGAALNENVTGFQECLALVHERVNLALSIMM